MIETMLLYGLMFTVNFHPYAWGGNDPSVGADCSGFVLHIYRSIGYNFPDMSSQDIFNELEDRWDVGIRRGGLLFFGKSKDKIKHIAISLGDATMIEAGGGDRSTVSEDIARFQNARVRISPIRDDLVAALYDGLLY